MSPRLVLEIVGADQPAAELPRAGVLVIGSDADKAGLVLDGQGVADAHCAIGRVKGGGWALKDLGSDYGTLLNGERIESARLSAGDQVLLGSRRLRVVDPDAAPEEAPPAAPPPPPAAPPPSSSAKVPQIPGFELERLLGRGSGGDVWLAVQKSLDRRVAIKLLPTALADDREFVDRFQSEARAAAALGHANIVTVHDVGAANGLHYLTMEYMDSGSLETRLAGAGRLPWREVLDILHGAASGLVFAESRGIVHRDIKPANLMQNHSGVTKIADLGLATQIHAQDSGDDKQRKVFGTPHFMAPEQVRGETLDCRTDLYALGATAYRLLSGATPFEGKNTRDILRGHLYDAAPALDERVPDLPAGVTQMVHRLLEKSPSDRFPSASVLVREIERLKRADGMPEGAAAAARSGGPPKGLLLGGGVLVLVLAVVTGIALLGGDPGDEPGDGGGTRGPEEVAGANGPNVDPTGPDIDPDPSTEGNGGGETTAPVDDDRALELRNTQAELALLQLSQRQLSNEERKNELLRLAKQYAGTTAASKAQEQAAQIDADMLRAEREAAERTQRLDGVLTALRAAAEPETGEPPRPLGAFTRMERVPDQELLAGDAEFEKARTSIRQAVIDRAIEFAQAQLASVEKDLEQGRYDTIQKKLESVSGGMRLEPPPEDPDLRRVVLLRELVTDARQKLDGLDDLIAQSRARLSRAETRTVAATFHDGGRLVDELSRLDLAAAKARLQALSDQLLDGPNKDFVEAQIRDCTRAAEALALLGREFGTGGWRRTMVADPRSKRNATVDVVDADTNGLVVQGDGGTERLDWSAFGGHTEALHQLFNGRLQRSYTPDELARIRALLRISAVCEALGHTAEMFQPGQARFTPRERTDLLAIFEPLADWKEDEADATRGARELEAVTLLGEALALVTDEAWTTAVTQMERLLEQYEDTLLVALLSDGTDWREPPPKPPAPERPEDGTATPPGETPDGDGGAVGPDDEGSAAGGSDGGTAEKPAPGGDDSKVLPRRHTGGD